MAALPTRSGAHRAPEIIRLRRSITGVYVLPADAAHHPMLTVLYGGATEEVGKPLDMSLEETLQTIREVAKSNHIGVSVCGRSAMGATVRVWPPKRPPHIDSVPEVAALPSAFAALRGDATHCGVADFYPDHEAALRVALASREAFTTGWYSSKKAIQTARVTRPRPGGPLLLDVSCEMDDAGDLADTALWKAAGGNGKASCGADALRQLGLDDSQIEAEMAALAGLVGATSACQYTSLHHACGFDRVCSELKALADAAEGELEAEFEGLVEAAEDVLARLRGRGG